MRNAWDVVTFLRRSFDRRDPTRVSLAFAAACFFVTACTTSIDVPPTDPTPPVVKMDVYGIPVQASPPSPDAGNEEFSLIGCSNCQPISRWVPLGRKLDLFASGEDLDGGMKKLTIIIEVFLYCQLYPELTNHYEKKVEQPSPQPQPAGPTAPSKLLAQASVRLKEHRDKCNQPDDYPIETQVQVYAVAENAHGAVVNTEKVILFNPIGFPLPSE